MNNVKINSKNIGTIFALTLLIPANYGVNILGINLEDIPLILLFLLLLIKKIKNFKVSKFDKYFYTFLTSFIVYTSFISSEFTLFNQVNLRFYFYFFLGFLCVDLIINNSDSLLDIFSQLWIVMIANFIMIIFQFQLPGTIDGWVLNNSGSTNPFTSGRLGGFQGGGPNVIGIFCALYAVICIYKISSSDNFKKYLITDKFNSFILFISIINLYLTFSRGSYLAFFVGLTLVLLFSKKIDKSLKIKTFTFGLVFSLIIVYLYPSIFLKQSNRAFLNTLGINNLQIVSGSGGGNYVKEVYKEYLITLDKDVLKEEFNIVYLDNDSVSNEDQNKSSEDSPSSGFLKLKFDYRDTFLPRSVVSFYYSNDELNWNQIGSDHTSGLVINLLENTSFFEVGGFADGQSPGGSYLDGYIKKVTINTENTHEEIYFTETNRDEEYFIYLPISDQYYDNRNDGKIVYKDNAIKLKRPRSYWIALPNNNNISGQDFEIIIQLELNNIPKGNETLFSQSSILSQDGKVNNQSWKWSIIDGRMYFFWVEDVVSGYSNFLGGQSLRSGKLISNDGMFSSSISEFSLSQYDEITTSHNGFLTMAVEYGILPVLIIVLGIFYLVFKYFKQQYNFEIVILLMLLTQNLTNDLIYAPDVAIYFWLIPIFLLSDALDN
ncbi:MAG: O-antigen ligase family protein [Flavobacteriaceae bacterium]